MQPYFKIGIFVILFAMGFSFIGCGNAAVSAGSLVKGSGSAVYYIDRDGSRYVFPNSKVYESWYSDYNSIITLSDQAIASMPLGGNVTMRPGNSLVKITTDPKVYAISPGSYLHWIKNEDLAADLYGTDWNNKIADIPDVYFADYKIDTPIDNPAEFDKNDALKFVTNIQEDLDARFAYRGDRWMTMEEKKVMNALTNIFESGEQFPSFSMVENLNDGRGYTSGAAGFTTATGDAYLVVLNYNMLRPDNILTKYLNRLHELTNNRSAATNGLDGYPEAWQRAATDPVFRIAQINVIDDLYYEPVMMVAQSLGVSSALGKAFMYDTIIQHGGGTDPDSVYSIIESTNQAMGGSPADGVNESAWLKAMMDERQNVLNNATDPETREVWAQSAYRVDVYKSILNTGNLGLARPIRINQAWINTVIQ